MRIIALDELKTIEFELLCQVDGICRKNNIDYSLAYGTLLGAVRHKGFIPWDDDIDIFMKRNDYNRFVNYCFNNEIPFNIVTHLNCSWYNYPFAKVCAPGTVINEENTFNDRKLGVYIDVFPIDIIGESRVQALNNYRKTEFTRDLITAANWKKYFKSKSHSLIYEPIRFLFFVLTRFIKPKNLIEKLENAFNKIPDSHDAYYGNIYSPYREREVVSRLVYSGYTELEFEGKKFQCISNYELYLSNLYGEYMKLPSVEKQISHHMFSAWWID